MTTKTPAIERMQQACLRAEFCAGNGVRTEGTEDKSRGEGGVVSPCTWSHSCLVEVVMVTRRFENAGGVREMTELAKHLCPARVRTGLQFSELMLGGGRVCSGL